MDKEEMRAKLAALEERLRFELREKRMVMELVETLSQGREREQVFLATRVSWALKQAFADLAMGKTTFSAAEIGGGVAYGELSDELLATAVGRAALCGKAYALAIVFDTSREGRAMDATLKRALWSDHAIYLVVL